MLVVEVGDPLLLLAGWGRKPNLGPSSWFAIYRVSSESLVPLSLSFLIYMIQVTSSVRVLGSFRVWCVDTCPCAHLQWHNWGEKYPKAPGLGLSLSTNPWAQAVNYKMAFSSSGHWEG